MRKSAERRASRLGVVAVIMGVVLGLSTLLLVAAILQSAWSAERAGHQVVAEGVFDAVEAELLTFLEREETRSFLEYRTLYVPPQNVGAPGLVRSPLADAPADPFVLGYWQRDGDEIADPGVPRFNEVALAGEPTAEVLQRQERIRSLVALAFERQGTTRGNTIGDKLASASPFVVGRAEEGAGKDLAKPLQKKSSFEPILNKSRARKGSNRGVVSSTSNASVQRYVDDNALDATLPEDSADVPTLVEPFAGVFIDDEHLLLKRRVLVDGNARHQGMVLSLPRLLQHLQTTALAGDQDARLFLAPDATYAGYAFHQTLPEPLNEVELGVAISRIEVLARSEPWFVVALVGLIGFAAILSGWALTALARTELHFAQRRSDFAASVSHELKTPLTAIRMHTEMLREGMIPDEDNRQRAYGILTDETERLSRLIHSVLELARLEKGTKVAQQSGDIGPLVARVHELVGPTIKASGAHLDVHVAQKLPMVRFEEDGLQQVLVNLVDNAAKFSKKSSDRTVVLTASPVASGVRISVADRGPGVDPARIRRLFEPFYRAERELVRETQGTGIGLALVAGLVQRMGGRVMAKNRPEGGLEVEVFLRAVAS